MHVHVYRYEVLRVVCTRVLVRTYVLRTYTCTLVHTVHEYTYVRVRTRVSTVCMYVIYSNIPWYSSTRVHVYQVARVHCVRTRTCTYSSTYRYGVRRIYVVWLAGYYYSYTMVLQYKIPLVVLEYVLEYSSTRVRTRVPWQVWPCQFYNSIQFKGRYLPIKGRNKKQLFFISPLVQMVYPRVFIILHTLGIPWYS